MSFFSTDLTKGKLILLYFLDKTGFAVSEEQLFRIVNKNEWLDYFSFQQAMSQMQESDFISIEESRHGDLIAINEAGHDAIDAFQNSLPQSLRDSIDDYAQEHSHTLRQEAQFVSFFQHIEGDEFMVFMQIFEQRALIYETRVIVYAQEAAQTLCNRWIYRGDEVYASMLSILTGSEE